MQSQPGTTLMCWAAELVLHLASFIEWIQIQAVVKYDIKHPCLNDQLHPIHTRHET